MISDEKRKAKLTRSRNPKARGNHSSFITHNSSLLPPLLIFLAVLGVYLLTPMENRSEAEDAYAYALSVEQADLLDLLHRHHLLYAPAMKLVYTAAQTLGYGGRSLPVMAAVSNLAGALSAMLVFLLCRKRLGMAQGSSIAIAALLAISYGFWRYACEAEIYVPGTAAALLAVYLTSRQTAGPWGFLAGGLAAGFSILVHILNVIPAIAMAVFILARDRKFRHLVVYGMTAGLPVVAAYTIAVAGPQGLDLSPGQVRAKSGVERLAQPATYGRGLIGGGQVLVSGNFLFAHEPVREKMRQLFPHRVFDEEFFMGEQAGPSARIIPLITLSALLLAGCSMLVLRWKTRGKSAAEPRPYPHALCAALALWGAAYAALILIREPGNPEMWIMGLVPLWLIVGCLVLDPVVRVYGLAAPGLLIATLCAHNYLGGLRLLGDAQGDYHAMKSAWVIEEAQPEDTVLTAGNSVFVRYLRYHTDAHVDYLYEWTKPEMDARYLAAQSRAGKVYAMGDLFAPPAAMVHKFPEAHARITDFAERIAGDFEEVQDNAFGGVYLLTDSEPL